MKVFVTTLLVMLVLHPAAWAIESEQGWESARKIYYASLKSEQAIQEAISKFIDLAAQSENEGLALTYLGSLTALKAKYTPWPTAKFKYANEGLAIMDKGLAKNPNNLEALFIHGSTCYYLPFFFNRKDDAERSFKRILKLLPQTIDNEPPELVLSILDFILAEIDLDQNERAFALQWIARLRVS